MELSLGVDPVKAPVKISLEIGAGRVLVFPFPRSILKRIPGAAVRLNNLQYKNDQVHTHDMMFTMLVLNVLAQEDLVRKFVQSAYVDERDPNALVFILVFRPGFTVARFKAKVNEQIALNYQMCGVTEMQVDEEPTPAAAAAPTAGAGATARSKPPFVKRLSLDEVARRADLKKAYYYTGRESVPVHEILRVCRKFDAVLGWGQLITRETELATAITDWAKSRFKDKGYEVLNAKNGGPAPPAPQLGSTPITATNPALPPPVDPEDFVPDDPANAAPNPAATPLPVPGDGNATDDEAPEGGMVNIRVRKNNVTDVYTMPLAFDAVFDCHSLPSIMLMLVDQEVHAQSTIPAAAGVWHINNPSFDLPGLSLRYLVSTTIYDKYDMFAHEMLARKDALLANAAGDLAVLGAFLSANPQLRDSDPRSAVLLMYDVITKKGGRLPKSWLETMASFTSGVERDGNMLPAFTDVAVARYHNLTYAGNYALYLMSQFELTGTFNFHCEQIVSMLVLDGVAFRPQAEDEDDEALNSGMCGNLLCYGPPGVGKSTAAHFLLKVYKFTFITNSYASSKSIYSNLPASDFLNNKAQYNDEAPAWIPESGGANSKTTPQQAENISLIKEKLSSGRMVAERLVRDEKNNVHSTVQFNVDVPHAPMVMNTNAKEKAGHPPLLDRFISRFYLYKERAKKHAIIAGAPPLSKEHSVAIRREFETARTLLLIVSKLQNDGVIPFPSPLVFKAFYETFLAELRLSPWLDCDPPTAGDRRSSIMETMNSFMVTRQAIHELFIDKDAPYAKVPFDVTKLLELKDKMCVGDIQTAMLVIGTYSHGFRSPTEYRCAELLGDMIMTNLRGEYKKNRLNPRYWGFKCPADPANHLPAKEHDDPSMPCGFCLGGAPADFSAYSPDNIKRLRTLVDDDPEREARFVGPGGYKNPRYVFLCERGWGAKALNLSESCDAIAHDLLEGNSSNTNKMLPEHAAQRLWLLAMQGARCGEHAGHKPFLVLPAPAVRQTHFFVLADWMRDCLTTREFSVHNMLKRAAFSCAYTAPGTYVTLDPLVLAPEHGHPDKVGKVVPQLLQSFVVPVHAHGCAARAESMEKKRNFNMFYTFEAATRAIGILTRACAAYQRWFWSVGLEEFKRFSATHPAVQPHVDAMLRRVEEAD